MNRNILGFNLTNFDPNVVIRVKDYVLRKVELAQDTWERIDAEGRNISQWRNVRVEVTVLYSAITQIMRVIGTRYFRTSN